MSDTKTARAAATVQPPTYLPLGVHLAGSIPLPSAEDVFRAVSEAAVWRGPAR